MYGTVAKCLRMLFALGLLVGYARVVYADNTPTATTDQTALRLNEFMTINRSLALDPKQPTLYPDWIEIFNPSASAVSLAGLFLANSATASPASMVALPTSLEVPANGFLLLFADSRPDLGAQHIDFTMTKSGGYIGLYTNQGNTLIDSIKYKTQYPDIANGRAPDGTGQWRYLTQPTPGDLNAAVTPFIRQIQRTPAIPTASVAISVTTVVTDNGTTQATLFYTLDGGALQAVSMVAESNPVSGTKFVAQIPPQPSNTLVRYYITAQDNDALQYSAPAGAPTTTHAYKVDYQPATLYINELMADNTSVKFPGDNKATPDWLELYNPGPNPVDLSQYYLTTDKTDPRLFKIPDGQTIPAGGFLVFLADKTPAKGPVHTTFSLSEKNGGFIGLYDELSARYTDATQFGPQGPNISSGRYPDGGDSWQMSLCSSPEATNANCSGKTLSPGAYLPFIQK